MKTLKELEKKYPTATAFMIEINEKKRLKLIKANLAIVLDFVERYNKQDKEIDVANAAQFLEQIFN